MLQYGVKLNGRTLKGRVEDVDVTLAKLPDITLPQDSFRVDEFMESGKRKDRYINKTDRETGRLVLTLYTQRVDSTIKGRTSFEELVILPLTRQIMVRVELEETEGLIYVCTVSGNITKQNVGGKSGIFNYTLEFDIEWIERRVIDEVPLTFTVYPLDPSKKYYISYRTQQYKSSFGYTLLKGDTEELPDNHIHSVYTDGEPAKDIIINTLTQTATGGGRLVGVFTAPCPLITGYDGVNIFSRNSGGHVTIREVV